MTNTELKIFEIIKSNPLISQQDIAVKLGITRSSVGVHISNLKNKGVILGMGYIVPESEYMVVIGGANVDIVGKSNHDIIKNDSNVGIVEVSVGGVGRNISENLTRLNVKNYLIAPIGDDYNGRKIISNSEQVGIDLTHSFILENTRSSSYMAILDNNRDMLYAVADMDIMNCLDSEALQKRKRVIQNAKFIILDANLSEEALKFIFENFDNKIIVDTVSTEKSKKFIPYLDKIYLMKPNKYELEKLSGVIISANADIEKAALKLINTGLKHLIVTMGEKGAIYFDKTKLIKFSHTQKVDVKNATGAGDAFMAGMCYELMKDKSIKEVVISGMSAAKIALQSDDTVNPDMSEEKLLVEREGIIC